MSWRTVELRDGALVVVKSGPDRARLAHEAEVLRRCAHPGVVSLVAERTGDDGEHELVLAHAGEHSWATHPPGSTTDLVDGLAAVAATVADLHELGYVHGRVTADHLVVSGRRPPVLGGFAGARRRGVETYGHDPVDPAAGPGDTADPTSDVYDLGRLLLDGFDRLGAGETALRRLHRLGRSAVDPDPLRRPTARLLAEELSKALPRRPRASLPRRGPGLVAAGMAVLVVIALAVAAWPSGPTSTPTLVAVPVAPTSSTLTRPTATAPPDSVAASAPPSSSSTPPSTTPRSSTTPPSPQTEPATTRGAPPPDPERDPIRIEHDGALYEIAPQDETGAVLGHWVIGDWDCDGMATVAIHDAASGSVLRFDDWPGSGDEVRPRRVGVVPDLVALEAAARPAGCERLVAITADGTREVLP